MAGEQNKFNFVVELEQQDTRIDYLLADRLDLSRSQAQKLIREEKVRLDDELVKPKQTVQEGQTVAVDLDARLASETLRPVAMPLDILFEDEAVVVVNKAAGIVVHPGAGTTAPTLVEGLAYHLGAKAADLPGPSDRPGVVHRLDKDTSGVMVFAKTTKALAAIGAQFAAKTNLREYFAICRNQPAWDKKTHESYLGRDLRYRTRYRSISEQDYSELEESKQSGYRFARSHFSLRKSFGKAVSLVQVQLETGRTHQIRVHARDLKIPIIGDPYYGTKQSWHPDIPKEVLNYTKGIERQMLHARVLGFEHPTTGKKLAFEVELPQDMKEFIAKLEAHAAPA